MRCEKFIFLYFKKMNFYKEKKIIRLNIYFGIYIFCVLNCGRLYNLIGIKCLILSLL